MVDPPRRDGLPILTYAEAEIVLLGNLNQKRAEYEEAIWKLVQLYGSNGQHDLAKGYIERLMGLSGSSEAQASYWLALGQLAEKDGHFEAAVDYYSQAKALDPKAVETEYFTNNNLGYSLIQLGRHSEAEPCCRMAIETDPKRHNAHKNLGLALQGQGRYADAARPLINAIRANPLDRRALQHLEEMVAEKPEILDAVTYLREDLNAAREADLAAAQWSEERERRIRAKATELSPAERILIAFGGLMLELRKKEFSMEELRGYLGQPPDGWDAGFAAAFSAMADEPSEGHQSDDDSIGGLLSKVGEDLYALTETGFEALGNILGE